MRANVDRQLAEVPPPVHFTVLADAVRAVEATNHAPAVLEVGCGVGHSIEILDRAHTGVSMHDGRFKGLDISDEAIRLAKERYPECQWFVGCAADALKTELVDIVLDSSCVLHVEDWRTHLAALCAASRDAVILHRIPAFEPGVLVSGNQRRITRGYGREFQSWLFDLSEVRGEMTKHGFRHTETRKADGDSLTLTFRKAGR